MRWARPIASGVMLLALAAGLPIVLTIATGAADWPRVSSWDQAWALVSSQAGGKVFTLALLGAGWAGWAVFASSLVVEVAGMVRGRQLRPVPGLASGRHLAALLLAGVAVSALPATASDGHEAVSTALPDTQALPVTDEDHEPEPGNGSPIGGLLAASVVGLLETKRTLATRTLRPGQRLWTPEEQDQQVETQLRHVADRHTLDLLAGRLDGVQQWCQANARPLPALAAVRAQGPSIRLYLTGSDHLPPDWQSNTGRDVWTTTTPPDKHEEKQPSGGAPWPCLVSLGKDHTGATVLLELERSGQLRLAGEAEVVEQSLRAMVCELVTKPAGPRLTLVGVMPELAAAVGSDRVRYVASAAEALTLLSPSADDKAARLTAVGADAPTQARGRGVAPETWGSDVVVLGAGVDPDSAALLAQLTQRTPRVGVVALGQNLTCKTVLHLDSLQHARLSPSGIDLQPQLLDERAYRDIIDLLAGADEPVEGPSWARNLAGDTPLPSPTETVAPASGPLATTEPVPLDLPTPRVRVLGPIQVDHPGAHESTGTHLRQVRELVVYLALNPDASAQGLSNALWPGATVSTSTRNAAVSRARRWLGDTPDGSPHLPPVSQYGTYHLAGVSTDWDAFQEAIGDDITTTRTSQLQAGLDLVRGQPMAQSDAGRHAGFGWAAAHAQHMRLTITDVVQVLANRYLQTGDLNRAVAAAHAGVNACPDDERLWRLLIEIMWRQGDNDGAENAANLLRRKLRDLDALPESETSELLSRVQGVPSGASKPARFTPPRR